MRAHPFSLDFLGLINVKMLVGAESQISPKKGILGAELRVMDQYFDKIYAEGRALRLRQRRY